ncbi:hypothetical protein ACH4C2_35150 [Streptomyces sp. NPDC018057]|uniref:hypothetical protein n=1 Tax=unclassified Streptomyces TaxID=2593676 RepID=UPI0037A6AC79
MNAFTQHRDCVSRARESHKLIDIHTDEATVNVTRSRVGRSIQQGFLTQSG